MRQIVIQMPDAPTPGVPDFAVQMMGVSLSMAAGVMLAVYMDISEEFLKQHPPTCMNCDAYVSHLQIKKAMKDIVDDIAKHPKT